MIRDARLLAEPTFREEFVHAGEDYLFWMECSRHTGLFAFSTDIECMYGKGVNLYSGSGWGTDTYLNRILHETCYRKAIGRLFELNGEQRRFIAWKLRELREAFARALAHRLRHRKQTSLQLIWSQFQADPYTLASLIPNMIRAVLHQEAS